MNSYQIIEGNSKEVLKQFPDNYFHCIVTSPPYWQLRDYSCDGQLGMEKTPEEFVANLVAIMRESRRTLRKDGVMWMIIGDTYSTPKKGNTQDNVNSRARRGKLHEQHIDKKTPKGMTKKNLLGIPWKVAFGLQDDGWILRCDTIWSKNNPLPDGAKDRPTRSHEYVFMFTKEEKYFYDYVPVMENATSQKVNMRKFGADNQKGTFRKDQDRYFIDNGKRNRRSVWTIPVASGGGKHFAVFPENLIEPCIKSSTSSYGCCSKCNASYKTSKNQIDLEPTCQCDTKEVVNCRVLDPFSGISTTGVVCLKNNVDYVGIELNPEYIEVAKNRLRDIDPIFAEEIK